MTTSIGSPEEGLPPESGWMEAARSLLWAWDNYIDATKPVEQASYLVQINNAAHDLATWLPEFDIEIGWLRGEDG